MHPSLDQLSSKMTWVAKGVMHAPRSCNKVEVLKGHGAYRAPVQVEMHFEDFEVNEGTMNSSDLAGYRCERCANPQCRRAVL